MKIKASWIIAIILGLALLFFLPSLLLGRAWTGGPYGMMGPGMMGGISYFPPLGFAAMALMWLAPIGLLVLVVLGAAWLFNALSRNSNPPLSTPGQKCSSCGRTTQANWVACPYCGEKL